MKNWERAYSSGAFKITTDQPSTLVRENADFIPPKTKVADLGCGNGRNSIFLAGLDHEVDAYDVADLEWHIGVDGVNFHQKGVEEIALAVKNYGAVLMMRLIQYLPEDQVKRMLAESAESLVRTGVLMLDYSVSGGVHNATGVRVEKYQHDPDMVVDIIESNGLSLVHVSDQVMPQQNVNLSSGDVRAFSLVGQMP